MTRPTPGAGRSMAAAALLALVLSVGPAAAIAGGAQLVFFNWPDYLADDVEADFEEAADAQVETVFFESNSERDARIAGAAPEDFDVVLVNGAQLEFYRERGWLAPIPLAEVPNQRAIAPRWADAYPAARGHAVPYFWGTTGIGYRRDLVGRPMASWLDIFRPDDALCGRIVMPRDPRELVPLALKALGHSTLSTDPGKLEAARRLLLAQKPCVLRYAYPALDETSGLVTGEVLAAVLYSGDSLLLAEYEPHVEYAAPVEGTTMWVDYLVVPAGSSRKQAAYSFIDFLNRPEVAARQANTFYYATPNAAAGDLLPPHYHDHPVIHPSAAVIAASEFEQAMPLPTIRHFNEIYAEVVAPGGQQE